MARPIKETPVITGEDAERFLEDIKNPIPESPEEIAKAKEVYEQFKAIARFDF